MELNGTLEAIANVGFPIVVAVYLLLRIENKMDKLTEAVGQLTLALDGFRKEAQK